MKFTSMETPSTRADFEQRMNYLREQMIGGKVKSAMGPRGFDGLSSVRYLPNGRIDLLSINEQARLSANHTYQMRDMNFSDMFGNKEGK